MKSRKLEIEEIRKIVDKELGGEYIEGGEHFRREFTENLISAYKIVLTCIRIENGEGQNRIRIENKNKNRKNRKCLLETKIY